jgi:large subunit ribosomal protein L23
MMPKPGRKRMKFKDPFEVIQCPIVTEKTMFQMERENKLAFIVRREATKLEIKNAIEKLFEVKVAKVNTRILKEGKVAYVKLSKDYSAEEIGMRVGVF